MPVVEVDGVRIAVESTGETGPAVLCCHSTGLAGMQFRRLARSVAPRRVLMPDWLGYGASDRPGPEGKDWTVDRRALLQLLEAESEPVDLVGHSYGGFLALGLARDRPEKVCRVIVHEPVLWGALVADGSPEHKRHFAELVASFDGLERGGEDWLTGFVDFWNVPGAWQSLPEPRKDDWRRDGAHIATEVHNLLDDATTAAEWAKIEVPVLFTMGEQTNPLARHACELVAEAIDGSRWQDVPGGHMAPVTHARSWLDAVLPALTSADGT